MAFISRGCTRYQTGTVPLCSTSGSTSTIDRTSISVLLVPREPAASRAAGPTRQSVIRWQYCAGVHRTRIGAAVALVVALVVAVVVVARHDSSSGGSDSSLVDVQ